MTSGSNCRHLNKPQTEDASRSILPAYHRMTVKLQHFPEDRRWSKESAGFSESDQHNDPRAGAEHEFSVYNIRGGNCFCGASCLFSDGSQLPELDRSVGHNLSI